MADAVVALTEGGTSLSEAAGAPPDEDPALSSAALCIELRLGAAATPFRPVYTHQCFAGERVRGYRPTAAVLESVLAREIGAQPKVEPSDSEDPSTAPYKRLLHSSHAHHATARYELSMAVRLAPCGQCCRVQMDVTPVRPPRRQSKRRRIQVRSSSAATEDHEEVNNKGVSSEDQQNIIDENNGSNNNDDDESWSSGQEGDGFDSSNSYTATAVEGLTRTVTQEDSPASRTRGEGATRTKRMPVTEIRQRLQQALPSMMDTDDDVVDSYLRRPVGTVWKEYSTTTEDTGATLDFCLTLATGREAATYHQQVQTLALWFIETADAVDVADNQSGSWQVLYLFQKHGPSRFSLVGYLTLYHFAAPFRKPVPGTVVRICQALVLPPYQGAGHGQAMLQAVHDIYQKRPDVVEVNVEDPAPAFVALRNRVDYEYLCRLDPRPDWMDDTSIADNGDETDFATLSDARAVQTATRAKITVRQVHICHELFQLSRLNQHLDETTTSDRERMEKQYRLLVKKRLNREHREELSGCRNKAEMQARLTTLYDQVYGQYQRILKKVR